MHPLFERLVAEVRTDIGQMVEEGHDIDALRAELAAAEATGSLDAVAALQVDLWRRPSPPEFPYDEPSDWQTLRAGFPDPHSHAALTGGEDVLADRLLAAWRGRCAGCQLGKPLEGLWPDDVRRLLTAIGSWPLDDYPNTVARDRLGELMAEDEIFRRVDPARGLTKGAFGPVAADDDIHYAITGLITLERHGPDFTPDQAVETLIEFTPASSVFASGRNMFRTHLFGLRAPATARFGNAFRQSLGAQIRCDPFGWAAPGNPALAARMAYKDASASQTRNGIYSGIFFATVLADALAIGNVPAAVATGARYVPPRSRFAEMVRFVTGACAGADDWLAVNQAVYDRYDRLYNSTSQAPMNHGLINAAITVMALLTGRGDFTRTIGIAAMAGRDTDCNAATAGSVMGCALGTRGIPAAWTDPFGDAARTHLKGMPEVAISDLARRTLAVALPNARWAGRSGKQPGRRPL